MFGIPVIMDMWENYPEALRLWGKTNWKTRIFKNYRVARAVELFATRRLDHIITVVDEQKERLIEDGVDANRVSVITNGFDPEMFLATPLPEKALTLDAGTYNLLYVGAVTPERGLADIVRALKLVLPEVPQARLIIAGDGPEENRLKHIAQEEGVSANVKFLGWVPFQDIQLYVKQSDLCLVPHVYNEFINTTIPNKIFQYMAMSKPVLVSQAKPLARIVRECDCGFVFQSGDPKDAAAKVLDAYRRRDDVTIGARGRSQVMQKYTWDHCARELLRIYAGLSRMPALEAAL